MMMMIMMLITMIIMMNKQIKAKQTIPNTDNPSRRNTLDGVYFDDDDDDDDDDDNNYNE